MQQSQQQLAMKDMEIKSKELDAKAASLKNPESAKSAPAKAQKVEIKLSGDAKKKATIKKEEYAPLTPKPLSEEDKRLIESMTKAIEKVSKEDIEEVEEFRDEL
jgi:hypothetical protein